MGKLQIPSLKEFLLQRRVIQLYRDFFRSIKEVPDLQTRKELTEWVRTDFNNNKLVTDEHAIKMLILHGEQALKELRESITLSK